LRIQILSQEREKVMVKSSIRRIVLLGLTGLIVSSILLTSGGCAGQEPETSTPSPGDAPSATDESVATPDPVPDQELVVGVEEDGYTREGDDADVGLYPVNINVAEPLVALGPNFEVLPLLATDWEYVGENTWRFHLRQGVKFHDGQEFDATAVKYSLDRIARTGGGTIQVGEDSVKIVDDYTVDITPTKTNMRLVQQLVHTQFSIIAPGTDPGDKPVGTGPFVFEEYKPEESISVVRNPGYWGEEAKLERITFKFIPDRETRVMALEAGDVDVIIRVPMESVDRIRNTSGLKVLFSDVGAYTSISANISGEESDILTDRQVRLAIAHALDRDAIVEHVWAKNAATNQTIIPPSVLGEYKSLVQGFTYDTEKAQALLEEAGWEMGSDGVRVKDGQRLSLVFISGFPSAEVHRPVPEIVQAQLAEIGIEVEIVEIADTGSYHDLLKEGKGDLWIETGNQNNADPTFLPYLLHHTDGYYSSALGYRFTVGEEFDELMDNARATSDIEECKRFTAEALQVLIDQEAVAIPIASHYQIWAAKDNVEGFVAYPSRVNQYNWNEVSFQ
jgi:peptide/nickel transport system substrate-binding protein